jgi:transposase
VGISTVTTWVRRWRETGSITGGHRPKKLVGHWRAWLLERCCTGEFTLPGLVAELAERGLKVDYRSVWEFVHGEKLTHKKDADRRRTGPPRRGVLARSVVALPPPDRRLSPGAHR